MPWSESAGAGSGTGIVFCATNAPGSSMKVMAIKKANKFRIEVSFDSDSRAPHFQNPRRTFTAAYRRLGLKRRWMAGR
jgi:hypothetical protein